MVTTDLKATERPKNTASIRTYLTSVREVKISYIFFTSVTQSLGEEKECKLTFLIIYLCINKIISFSPPHYLPKRFPAQASFLVTGHAIHAFNFLSKRCSFEGKGKGFWIAFSIIFKNI